MFDIGWSELLVLAVVAIIVVGPKDLPGMLRSLGRAIGQLKRAAGEFRTQFDEALRESELHEIKDTVDGIGNINPLDDIKREIDKSIDPVRNIPRSIEKAEESPGEGREDIAGPVGEWNEADAQKDPEDVDSAGGGGGADHDDPRRSVVERAAAAVSEHAGDDSVEAREMVSGDKRGA